MKISQKLIALAVFALLGLHFASPAHAQQVPIKIAVVDMEQVLIKSTAPKSIREQVNKIRSQYRSEVKKEETALHQANQSLAQKKTLLSQEAFKEERRKFEQKVLGVQKKVQQKNLSLQKAQNAAQAKVKQALSKVVIALAQQQGFTLVLRRAQTIVVAEQFDITNQVITELNKTLPKVVVTTK
ncbi:putative Outer membrane protein [Candidatus Terasakiella magnetica]|uniref:Putative Outer membrane protein n=1 Tax=Candidatus Terasakiella magnetica TaxID=1867952 RepID=A0A1C3RCM5_9PROT|nr:OmpH family outer membrane protein [Candidatus Terasakiella magnetica]SCA55029.1 putative Outer membrane protein [Candidatus Terasakiella magnetica]